MHRLAVKCREVLGLMSSYPVTLTVPDHVYDQARKIAEATDQPIEKVLIQHLEEAFSEPLPKLPPDEQAELDALAHLSDDALWTIAREQMSEERQARLQALMDKNSQGDLSEAEREELEGLVEQGQRLALRKAQASAALTARGQKVTPEALSDNRE
jgi:hypothetical protein